MIQINPTTFEIEIGEDKTQIGDISNLSKFMPTVLSKRWGDECWMKLIYPTIKNISPILDENGILTWQDSDKALRFYATPERAVVEEDAYGGKHSFTVPPGIEFEIVLPSKPAEKKITLELESQGLRFTYQRHFDEVNLSEFEPDGSWADKSFIYDAADIPICKRPRHISGSYVVYHSSKRDGDYMAGKAFHILCPRATDSVGTVQWLDLTINPISGLFEVDYDYPFFDVAVYPVFIGPDWGYTGEGGTEAVVNQDKVKGSLHTSPADIATATSLKVYAKENGTNLKGLICLHADSSIIANAITPAIAQGAVAAWGTGTFATPPEPAQSTDHIICAISDSAGVDVYWDEGDANQGHHEGGVGNDYDAPVAPVFNVHNTRKYSMYVVYTAAGGANAPTGVLYGPLMGPLGGPI